MKFSAIHAYIAALGAVALAAVAMVDWTGFLALPSDVLWGVGVLTGLGILSEWRAIPSRDGEPAATASLTFIPLASAVLLFGQGAAVLFIAVTGTVAELGLRKQRPLKAVFNLSQYILAAALAGWVFLSLGGSPLAASGSDGFSIDVLLPLLGFGFVALLTNHLAVTAAISITQSQPLAKILRSAFSKIGGTVIYDIMVMPVAILVALLYLELAIGGLLLSILPLVFIREAYLAKHRLMLANQDLLYALVKAIETRDPYTSGHARRVQDIAVRLGTHMRLSQRHLVELEQASLLHDIGKIEVMYEEILKKPSALTDQERLLIESHVHRGVEILRDLSSFSNRVIEGIRSHHELYDGSGYPDGLRGKDIPLFGRIIKISDAIDAMLSDRPYRKALSLQAVREELTRFSGRHFDPDMVELVASTELLERHFEQMVLTRSLRSGAMAPKAASDPLELASGR